jgi:hypothetical protein
MPNDFEPRVGHRFTFDTRSHGSTDCEVLAVEPERLIRMSWRNGDLDTEVTWRLVPEGKGTRLLIVHSGFDPDSAAYRAMSHGWAVALPNALRDVLERANVVAAFDDHAATPASSPRACRGPPGSGARPSRRRSGDARASASPARPARARRWRPAASSSTPSRSPPGPGGHSFARA